MTMKPLETILEMFKKIKEEEPIVTDAPIDEIIEDIMLGQRTITLTRIIIALYKAGLPIDRIVYWIKQYNLVRDTSRELRLAIERVIRERGGRGGVAEE